MMIGCSLSFACDTYSVLDNKVACIGNIGKTMVFSLVGTATVLTGMIVDLPEDTYVFGNVPHISCIECVDIDGVEEWDCLNDSIFLDLLKINNLKKIEHMAAFQEDWNGVGGLTFSSASIDVFKEIINNLCKQPDIAPTGRDSLFLQYKLDDYSLLAFEIRAGYVDMVYVPRGDYSLATTEVFTDNFIQQINSRVERFYGFEQN